MKYKLLMCLAALLSLPVPVWLLMLGWQKGGYERAMTIIVGIPAALVIFGFYMFVADTIITRRLSRSRKGP